MRKRNYLLLVLLVCFCLPTQAQVYLNEYSAANLKQFPDNFRKHEDWIEIHNNGATALDLSGWHLSDKASKPEKWDIPAGTTIPANGFLIFWCSGRDLQIGTDYHTNFKLSQTKDNETLLLTKPDGTIVDEIKLEGTLLGHSQGRSEDGTGEWKINTRPTPLASNQSSPKFDRYTTPPTTNIKAGFYATSQMVTLSTEEPNAIIRYTTDGSEPDQDDYQYTGPIPLNKTTVIKAKVYNDDPASLPGKMIFNTYFIGESFTLPVFSVAAEKMLDLANGDRSLRPIGSLEYFNRAQERTATSYGDLNSHGQDSWKLDHRSIDWVSRDEMGYSKAVNTKLFSYSDRTEYQRFMFRASGDDNYPAIDDGHHEGSTHLRDEYVHTLAKEGGLKLDVRAAERVIVFFNGEYWGLYGLRERAVDHDYTEEYYDQGKYDIQYLTTWGNTEAEYGGLQAYTDWGTIRDFILDNDMSEPNNYQIVKDNIQVLGLIDFFIINSVAVASDWLNYNTGWWRGLDPKGDHKKWGYIIWDLDATFNYYLNYTGIPNTGADAKPCDIDVISAVVDSFYLSHYALPDPSTCVSAMNGTIPYAIDDPIVQEVMLIKTACCEEGWTNACDELYEEVKNGYDASPIATCATYRGGSAPYAIDDPIYIKVSNLDQRCCINDWDLTCQRLYDELAEGKEPVQEPREDVGQHEKIFLKLLAESPEFKKLYYARYADLMNTTFSCDNMLATLDRMAATIEPEMPRQVQRWGGSVTEWRENLAVLRGYVEQRCTSLAVGLVDCYEPTAVHNITIMTEPDSVGSIDFNTLTIENFAWKGEYFGDTEYTIKATPTDEAEAYSFSHWVSKSNNPIADSTIAKTTFTLMQPDTLIAVFDIVSSTSNIDKAFDLSVYPNPAKDHLTVEYTLTQKEEVALSLYSIVGQEITTFSDAGGTKTSGEHTAYLDLSELPTASGLYFLVMRVGEQERSFKINLME